MSTRVKSLILLGCTLIAGIAIGILGTGAWQHRRNVTLSETRVQGGLTRHIERIIHFENEDQRSEVRAIVHRAEQSFMQQRQSMSDSLAVHRQILVADLQQALTPEQWQQLETWLDRKPRYRKKRRGHSSGQHRSSRNDSSNHKPAY